MLVISDNKNFIIEGASAVAVGKFDGIHRGHQKLIDKIIEAKKDGLKAVVYTFNPSPVEFFSDKPYKGLTTIEEKRRIFEQLGVDVLIEYPLDWETAKMSPESFVEKILVNRIHARLVVCGTDFTFGDKGSGNVEMLRGFGKHMGFEVYVSEKVKSEGVELGSSLIREEVARGNMEKVTEYIGAPYSITGVVTKGAQIGRQMGMPTVNLEPEDNKLLPPFGVYDAIISYKGEHYRGITNVGVKPTVTKEERVVVETFIYDFDKDIYDEKIIVSLVKFKRPERKFNSIEELKEQIKKDIEG